MGVDESFWAVLEGYSREAGLSLHQLAYQTTRVDPYGIGISPYTLESYRRGKRRAIRKDTISLLAKTLAPLCTDDEVTLDRHLNNAAEPARRRPSRRTSPRPTRIIGPLPDTLVFDFQGRANEIQQLCRFLSQRTKRLAIVYGPAAIGKTALVTKVVLDWVAHDPNLIVLYVPLGESDVSDLDEAIARALPPKSASDWRKLRDQSARYTRLVTDILQDMPAIQVRYLVILDGLDTQINADRVLTRAWSRFVDECVGVRQEAVTIVATSNSHVWFPADGNASPDPQTRFGHAFERIEVMEGLRPDDAVRLACALDIDAGRLHGGDELDAQGHEAGEAFEPHAGNALGIAQSAAAGDIGRQRVVELLKPFHGKPRGIKWLIGQMRREGLTLDALLADRLTLQHIAESVGRYTHLTGTQKCVVHALAIYERPVDLAAIARMFPEMERLEIATALQHLAAAFTITHSGGRYTVRPAEREDVLVRLSAEERATLHRAAADYYDEQWLSQRDTSAPATVTGHAPSRQEKVCMQEMLRHRDQAGTFGDIVAHHESVHAYYLDTFHHGSVADAAFVCTHMLKAAQRAHAPETAMIWLHDWSVCLYRMGQFQEAEAACREGMTQAEQRHLPDYQAHFWHRLGKLCQDQGRVREAKNAFTQAIRIRRKLGLPTTATESQRTELIEEEGDLAGGLRRQETCLRRAIRSKDSAGHLQFSRRIARLQRKLGDYDAARETLLAAIEMARSVGINDRFQLYRLLVERCLLAMAQRDDDALETAMGEAERVADTLGSAQQTAELRISQGLAHHYRGNYAAARAAYNQALAYPLLATSYAVRIRIGLIDLVQDNLMAARTTLHDGLAQCETLVRHTPRLYDPRYARALASLALTIAGDEGAPDPLTQYQDARVACQARGVRDAAIRDLDLVADFAPSQDLLRRITTVLRE